jgi:hypothetical protein
LPPLTSLRCVKRFTLLVALPTLTVVLAFQRFTLLPGRACPHFPLSAFLRFRLL